MVGNEVSQLHPQKRNFWRHRVFRQNLGVLSWDGSSPQVGGEGRCTITVRTQHHVDGGAEGSRAASVVCSIRCDARLLPRGADRSDRNPSCAPGRARRSRTSSDHYRRNQTSPAKLRAMDSLVASNLVKFVASNLVK